MKKYLMTGVAALAISAAFTSCSSNEELYNPEQITANEAAQIIENYNQAFIATFGQPAANQDWGFGSTRTRAENKNLNEWGDPAKNGGTAWDVPDALTPRQKLRARLYFQYNPNLTYVAPTWTDFFVQQVYKGNPATQGPNSAEEYTRVNTETVTGSNEMDYLFCATETTHINDFNDGEWNNGTPLKVLNTGCSANDYDVEGKTHLDQITLMVNSSAAYIGYGASTADAFKHKDCCALAGALTIDQWASSAAAQALGIDLGDPVYDERWDRSFVGLDFEGLNKEDCYLDPAVTVKASDFRADNTNYVIYGGNIVSADAFDWDMVLTYKGEAVKYLDDQVANKAFGEKMKIDGNQVTNSTFTKDLNKASLEAQYNTTLSGNNDVRVFNFDQLLGYINDGCAPTYTDKNMINITGARDYVYSDWIVTLTKAEKVEKEEEPEWDIRVIAEDLNAKAADSEATDDWSVGSDWDFNDVVFDVKFTSETTADVKIIGAGGVYPIYVADHEAHQALGQSGPDSNGRYKIQNSGNAEVFEVTGINKSNNARDIVIKVVRTSSSGQEIISELKAEVGKPAAKIGVNPKFKPCAERQDIRKKYPLFSQWVQGNLDGAWYTVE